MTNTWSRSDLQRLTGATRNEVDRLLASGLPHTKGSGRGAEYRVEHGAALRWLIDHVAVEDDDDAPDLTGARARLAVAQEQLVQSGSAASRADSYRPPRCRGYANSRISAFRDRLRSAPCPWPSGCSTQRSKAAKHPRLLRCCCRKSISRSRIWPTWQSSSSIRRTRAMLSAEKTMPASSPPTSATAPWTRPQSLCATGWMSGRGRRKARCTHWRLPPAGRVLIGDTVQGCGSEVARFERSRPDRGAVAADLTNRMKGGGRRTVLQVMGHLCPRARLLLSAKRAWPKIWRSQANARYSRPQNRC